MRKILIAICVLVSSAAFAESLHPCTPTVEMRAMRMNCNVEVGSYFITIQAWASPNIEICQGEHRIVRTRANVTYINGSEISDPIRIPGGEFSIEPVSISEYSFTSESHELHFPRCAVPFHGGFSIGN